MNNADVWVIEGVGEDGRRFRPSDWVERLATTGARFGADRRLRYLDGLRPAVIDGAKVLVVAEALRLEQPALFAMIMTFAESNRLRIAAPHLMVELAA